MKRKEEKNKTYFVCSDIHSFYKEWMKSLKEAGFDRRKKNHILIILGDIFDRGSQPLEIYRFINSLPEERVILIKGNHEYLLLNLVKRGFPYNHDYHNGTFDTLLFLYEGFKKENGLDVNRPIVYSEVEKIFDNKLINEIVEWIKSPRWLPFYELGKYIFVHSFIPLRDPDNNYSYGRRLYYYPKWREETDPVVLEMATWGCPYECYLNGSFDEEIKKGKILVCGHWHTSDFYNKLLYKDEPDKELNIRKDNPIFMSDKFPGLIAIDTCTVLTKKVNVLVIKEKEI